jgi:hypothetical protein
MIRRVAFKKALLGGVLGALAWEAAARVLVLFEVPMFDIVRILGTMLCGEDAPFWQWWPVGAAMHGAVGAMWAMFYAYFFWSLVDTRPILQGILFSFLPAALAGLVMIPQMDLMLNGTHPPLGVFARGLGVGGPVSVVVGHMIYGAILGSLYVRPVGYAVGKRMVYG